jgi:hypothetical protein
MNQGHIGLSPIKEKAFASNLSRIESKMRSKIAYLEMLLEYLGSQKASIKGFDMLNLKAEDVALFLTSIAEIS